MNWLQSSGMKPREPRRQVLLKARVRRNNAWCDTMIRNVSSRGLLLQCSEPLPEGSYIDIRRGRQAVVARVMWSRDDLYGVKSRDLIDIFSFVGETDRSTRSEIAPGRPRFERCAAVRTAAPIRVAEKVETSRWIGRIGEFATLVGLAAAGAMSLSAAVEGALETSFAQVASHLRRPQ